MGRKHLIIFAAFTIMASSAIALLFFIFPAISSESDAFGLNSLSTNTKFSEKSVVHLYFAGKDNSFLIAEEKVLACPDDPEQFGKLIIESLINGPKEGLMRTIPAGAALRALYVTKDKTAYVDISQVIKEKHPGGCKSEIITIYSIVNSLILNIPEINAVKILIDGQESMTLAGHIDLRFPLKADMLIVR